MGNWFSVIILIQETQDSRLYFPNTQGWLTPALYEWTDFLKHKNCQLKAVSSLLVSQLSWLDACVITIIHLHELVFHKYLYFRFDSCAVPMLWLWAFAYQYIVEISRRICCQRTSLFTRDAYNAFVPPGVPKCRKKIENGYYSLAICP